MRIMEKKEDVASNKFSPSDKFPVRELESRDLAVEGLNGQMTQVCYLPVAEVPPKPIYGEIDPLEGSPAREMTKKLYRGELPLGKFSPNNRENMN